MRQIYNKKISIILALILAISLIGCGKATEGIDAGAAVGSTLQFQVEEPADDKSPGKMDESQDDKSPGKIDESQEESSTLELSAEEESSKEISAGETTSEHASAEDSVTDIYALDEEVLIEEDGTYDSKEEVALYLHTYNKLPSNYITKKEAKKLGWSGGSLEDYAPGMCIGGDFFGNYEGVLPEDAEYHECDIETLGKKKRGAKRIVYSDDFYIYYTEDHYESFELLYEP